jgi:diguanylate cyclase (GGDEF)-like protein
VPNADDDQVEADQRSPFPAELASPELIPPAPGATSPTGIDHTRSAVFVVFGWLGALLVGYIAWLVARPHFSYSLLWNGWMPDGFELVVSGLCIARGLVRQSGRAVALALGFGLLSWSLGDTTWTVQSVIGTSSATRYLGALFYMGFYPLAYVAIVAFMRGRLRGISAPSFLDGAVAALGAAAVCAAFAFQGSEYAVSNDALTKATNLAYPLGDLVLFGLVAGAATLLSGRGTVPWLVLAGACVLNCIGDTVNLFQSSEGHFRVDAISHMLAWPLAGLLMATAVWLRPPAVDLFARQKPPSFWLPGISAASGLAVLVAAATGGDLSPIAIAIAIASLVAAGVRLVWSAQALRALTEHRQHQSVTDELTGLGNRRYLYDLFGAFFLDQSDATAARRTLTFMFLDLDRFKEINDSFGHLAGDDLLKQLGPRLTGSLGPNDVLVRYGGDEFGVVLMDASAERAASVAQELKSSLGKPFQLNGVSVTVGASIGIATAPADTNDPGSLLDCADVAMYRSKIGRCPFAFYDQRLDAENKWRLGNELGLAIEQHQFVLYYQTQLDLRSGQIAAVEALVRWQHPRLGLLGPAKFLPLAEQAELMPALTALLLDDALAQGSKWAQARPSLTVSVNISATNLLDHGFTDLVQSLLSRHRFPPSRLTLEITETSVIENFEQAKLVIEELASVGVIVSVDDYGAGFTALSYLSSLAVRELKLDMGLITNLASAARERDRELVRSTIELGHALGLRVVAEGIEDEATLDLLRQLQCDLAQGYFISRPVLADKVFPALDGQELAPSLTPTASASTSGQTAGGESQGAEPSVDGASEPSITDSATSTRRKLWLRA